MSNRRRPLPPLPNDPNQGNLFTRIRARFANLDRLFGLSWKFVVAGLGIAAAAMWAKLNSSSFPSFFWCTVLAGVLVVILAVTEIVRSLRQFETKIAFATIYVSLITCAVALAGFVLWQVKGDWTASQERQERERLEAEAQKVRIVACEADRKKELGRLEKRRVETQRALESCVAEFEAARTIFTKGTPEHHCQPKQAAVETANRNHRLATTKRCDAPDGK